MHPHKQAGQGGKNSFIQGTTEKRILNDKVLDSVEELRVRNDMNKRYFIVNKNRSE